MSQPLIAVLDYGIGNLRSAQKSLERMGADARLTADAGLIADAAGVVLPGVGAFGPCMAALRDTGLDEQARCGGRRRAAVSWASASACSFSTRVPRKRPVRPGWASCPALSRLLPGNVKRPQMQWNRLEVRTPSPLLEGLDGAWVYFVHSFAAPMADNVAAVCDYGGPVAGVVGDANVWATQFHPEKSARPGLRLLGEFREPGPDCGREGLRWSSIRPLILRGGRCVRLYQGSYDAETVYSDDPVSQAQQFADAGASWIHVVDLDAARTGDPANLAVIAAIADAVDVPVQTGGGVRSLDAAAALADTGVARVVIGTAAVETPELVEQVAARQPVAVGLDARGRDVATHGWEQGGGGDLLELAALFESSGAEAVVVTEISRDGTMSGPDTDGLSGGAGRHRPGGDRLRRGGED